MSALDIPFNISLLELNDKVLNFIKPVRVLDTFEGATKNFHDDGLFSQAIFGRIGEQERNKRFSYIDIKLHIFHPLIYKALTELKALYGEIMAGRSHAIWDTSLKDFVKADPVTGETGFAFFIRHWREINYVSSASEKRKNNIALIKTYQTVALTDKIVVLPAGLRDYEILDDGRESEDEFNKLYRGLLALSSPVSKALINEDSIKQFNPIRHNLQMSFNQLFDKIKSILEGKNKLILGKWASRAVLNGTRNVISTMNIPAKELDSPANVSVNDTIMGLFQYLKGTLPVTKFHIRHHFLSKVFVGLGAPVNLVNKETLKMESVRLKSHHYDAWMTDEGLDNTINAYQVRDVRDQPLEIEGYWVGLIYKGKGTYRLFQDIDDLPSHLDKRDVHPVTFTELLYLAVYPHSRQYPALITRYPITGYGSIYPSYIYLKPTMKVEVRTPLGDDWKIDSDTPIAYNFPVGNLYFDAMSPHPCHLKGLGAD